MIMIKHTESDTFLGNVIHPNYFSRVDSAVQLFTQVFIIIIISNNSRRIYRIVVVTFRIHIRTCKNRVVIPLKF